MKILDGLETKFSQIFEPARGAEKIIRQEMKKEKPDTQTIQWALSKISVRRVSKVQLK